MSLLPGFAPTAAEARAEEPDTAERQDDPTPRLTVRAVLEAVGWSWSRFNHEIYRDKRPVRVLDVAAGYGVWASEFRRWWELTRPGAPWPVHITGVEVHAPREPDLRKWCDEVVIADYFEALRDHHELPAFDIAIGNPHFTALTGKLTPGDEFGEYTPSMPEVLLEHAPAVLLLHTQQAFLRGEAGRAAWRRCPPAAAWLVPGSVKFRGPGTGSDARCYQVSLWLRGHEGPTTTHLLPELTAAERQWTVPPGSETPSADLPAAPGWTP